MNGASRPVRDVPVEAPKLAGDLGWLLARTRAERGFSVESIASAIHMRKHYIQALESGQFEELPGNAYVRGYLKRYAEFLELNPATILDMYDRLDKPMSRRFFALPVLLDRTPHPDRRFAMFCALLALGLFVAWGNAARQPAPPLVQPFAQFEPSSGGAVLPHRCEGNQSGYPPCYWEDLRLWYQLYPRMEGGAMVLGDV